VDATRAVDGAAISEAETALHRAISASRAVAALPAAGGAVDWAPDGRIANAALEPGVIEIRDGIDGPVVRSIDAHDGAITDIDFSADGRWLASTGEDGRLRTWDLATTQPGVTVQGVGAADDIAWSGDARRVAATWPDELRVRVLDPLDADRITEVRVGPDVGATAMSPNGDTLIVLVPRGDHALGLAFDVPSGARGRGDLGLDVSRTIHGVAWSPDGTSLATVGMDGIDLWDGRTLRYRSHLQEAERSWDRVAWSPDGEWLAVADAEEPAVRVFRADGSGASTRLTSQETLLGIAGLAFSPDGRRLVAGGRGSSRAKVWELGVEAGSEILGVRTIDEPGDVAFGLDGRAVVAADANGRLRSWDLASGSASPAFGFRVGQHQFELSPDGTTLVMRLYLNGLAAWTVEDGRRLFHTRDLGWVDDVAWSHDGEHVVAVVHLPEARVIVLDRRGQVLASFADPEGSPYSARFAPGDHLIGVVHFPEEGGGITFWDWQRDKVVRRIPSVPAGMVAFAPDGATVATGFGIATLLDSETGKPRVVIDGHPTAVADVAFSPDGSQVAVALAGDTAQGNQIRIFDAASGRLVLVLDPGDDRFLSRIAFSPDGSMLASQSTGLVRVWTLDLDTALSIARSRVTRPPTADECRRFRLEHRACDGAVTLP
jgi:WD40 repeat protein